jgi:Na+/H+ antiporter NhaA
MAEGSLFSSRRRERRLALRRGGLVLIASAALGLAGANSPLARSRPASRGSTCCIKGLMALFFLMVGLESKREMVEGQLDTRRAARYL